MVVWLVVLHTIKIMIYFGLKTHLINLQADALLMNQEGKIEQVLDGLHQMGNRKKGFFLLLFLRYSKRFF